MIVLLAIAAAFAEDPAPAEPPAPPPELTEEQRTQAFAAFATANSSGDKSGAADALLVVLDDPALGAAHAEAWAKLGDQLADLDLGHPALHAYGQALAGGAKIDTTKALDMAEAVGDEDPVAAHLLDGDGRARYIRARYLFRQGELGATLAMSTVVPQDSEFFADAQLVRGVTLSQQEQYTKALAPLLTAQGAGRERDARWQNLITLNIARAYYGAKNYGQAVQYYDQIERSAQWWPDATYERAWAHFRANDMTGALGQLHSQKSPHFDEWYFPEAELLRGYALFMLCKFPAANEQLTRFETMYKPVHADLERASDMTAAEAFDDVRKMVNGEDTRLPRSVLRPFTMQDRFLDAIKAVDRAQDDIDALKGSSARYNFAQRGTGWAEARRDAIIETEGKRVLARVSSSRDELKGMLDGVEITRIDILGYETQLFEKAAATGKLELGDQVGKLRKIRKTRRKWVWPFQGEYWGDELGWFQIDSRPDCPDGFADTK